MKTDILPFFLRDILVACSLLTRLPLPRLSDAAYATAGRAVWAYPIAGAVVGGCTAACVFVLRDMGLSDPIAAGLAIGFMAIITGAMHEDGLSDTADGFWGGYTPARRLEIMRDSQIGTYGTLALVVVTGMRWLCYSMLLSSDLLLFVAVAMVSRSAMPPLMHALPHARTDGLSHSVGRPDAKSVALCCALGLAGAVVILGEAAIVPVIVVFCVALSVGHLAKKKIGGQTGDVLGATQQLGELGALTALTVTLL